jgi:hypothetical protein
VSRHRHEPATAVLAAAVAALDAFAGGADPHDDSTLLVARRTVRTR